MVGSSLEEMYPFPALLLWKIFHDLVATIELSLAPTENLLDSVPDRPLTNDDSFDQPFHLLIGWKHLGIVGRHPQIIIQAGSTILNMMALLWSSMNLLACKLKGLCGIWGSMWKQKNKGNGRTGQVHWGVLRLWALELCYNDHSSDRNGHCPEHGLVIRIF